MTEILSPSIADMLNLTGKVAIVTGGGMGIGQAISYRLAEAGAAVMIADINLDAAKKTADKINDSGGKAKAILADASDPAAAEKVIKSTVDEFGSIDILANNAGIYPVSSTLEMTEEIWDKVINLNLRGVFFFSQAVAKEMIKAGKGGKIINFASIAALHPSGIPHYEASKAGVVMITKSLAFELAPYKISVNAIAPGAIKTPGLEVAFKVWEEQMKKAGMEDVDMNQQFLARTPIGRFGKPDDIAKVVLFLASELSGYMTGHTVIVDGGYLLS
ncbi:MAG: SDR family NAD(P)-dependent oxidoreductase [Promethearchaeota archaeon]